MKHFRIRWTWWISLAVLALAAASVTRTAIRGAPSDARTADKIAAQRELASAADEKLFVPDGDWVGGQGVVEPRDREVKVASAVAGRITAVLAKEGQQVRAGEALIELDAAVERSALAVAHAEAQLQEAELKRAKNGERWEDRQAIAADARAAQARAAQTKGIEARLRKALAGGGATGDEVDRAAKQAEADEASYTAADARRRAASAGSRSEDILSAEARLEAARSRLAEARARLDQRTVRAPADAEVLSIKVRAGEFYQPGGEALVVLGDTRGLRVRIDIDERDVGRLQAGAKVLVRASAYPGLDFDGHVVEVGRRMGRKNVRSDDPVERNDSKILEVVAELEPRGKLFVGQRVVGFVAARE